MTAVLVYLIGRPGTGKLTIAQTFISNRNYLIVDNHLINNPIFSLIRQETKSQAWHGEALTAFVHQYWTL